MSSKHDEGVGAAVDLGSVVEQLCSANGSRPAVSVTRTLSDTFAGIDPASAPMFVLMQLIGAVLAVGFIRVVYPN